MPSMQKSWLIVSFWLLLVFGSIAWSVHSYAFTPTFPYHQLTSMWPRLWSTLSHFDGVNYLRIAQSGYPAGGGEVAFFPLFPLLIHGLTNLGISTFLASLLLNGVLFILLIFFVITLYPALASKFFWLFLTFPASFFLLSVYSETLFLVFFFTFVACLQKRWFYLAALVAALASSTRLVGSILGVMLLVEYFRHHPVAISRKPLILLLISELGLLAYMYYLWVTRGDPLAFIHVQPQFGMGRSGGEIVLLPQVLYRYANMLIRAPAFNILTGRVLWELLTFLGSIWVLIKYWRSLSVSDRLYCSWVLILPTLSGTLSSFPRYALLAVPLFLVLAKHLKLPLLLFLGVIQAGLLVFQLILFTRGLFVA